MEVKIQILFLLFATSFCCGNEIADFVGELIQDLKVKEPSQVHDVVLLRLVNGNKEMTEKIAEVILLTNVVMMPSTAVVVQNQRIRAASVLIIVSDDLDKVNINSDFQN